MPSSGAKHLALLRCAHSIQKNVKNAYSACKEDRRGKTYPTSLWDTSWCLEKCFICFASSLSNALYGEIFIRVKSHASRPIVLERLLSFFCDTIRVISCPYSEMSENTEKCPSQVPQSPDDVFKLLLLSDQQSTTK